MISSIDSSAAVWGSISRPDRASLSCGARASIGQKLHVDVGAVHGGELLRQVADDGGLYAGAVDKTRDLDAGVRRQVRDKSLVYNVAADFIRNVGRDRFHDIRGVLAGALVRNVACDILLAIALPACDLIDAAARIFVDRAVVALDQLRILGLDEERVVFGVVLARFGAVVTEAADVLVADES